MWVMMHTHACVHGGYKLDNVHSELFSNTSSRCSTSKSSIRDAEFVLSSEEFLELSPNIGKGGILRFQLVRFGYRRTFGSVIGNSIF